MQMRHIFSTNEDVEYEQGTSSSFEIGRHYSKMFMNESFTLTGVSIKNKLQPSIAAYGRLQKPIS